MKNFGLSYRGKLTLLVFSLSLFPFVATTIFFGRLYREEKLAALYEAELSGTLQNAARLQNVITLARSVELERAQTLLDAIFLVDHVCSDRPRPYLLSTHWNTFEHLSLKPEDWARNAAVRKACGVALADPTREHLVIHDPDATQPKLPYPYLTLLLKGPQGLRLVAVPMDSSNVASAGSVFFLTDRQGTRLWGNARVAPEDESPLLKFVTDAVAAESASVSRVGSGIILAYAQVAPDWLLFEGAEEKAALAPVRFLLTQSLLLMLASLFFYFLAGKTAAFYFTRPIRRLTVAAERIAQGDLATRVEPQGNDEVTLVQRAFNNMAEQLGRLVEQTRVTAELESEVQIAQKVQSWFAPDREIRIGSHEIVGFVKMAKRCGGDWWSYIEVPQAEGAKPLVTLLIGDAAGHGLSSALLTASIQGAFALIEKSSRETPAIATDPSAILRLLNDVVFRSTGGEVTMSFFVAVLDENRNTLLTGNAGHNKPYLIVPPPAPGALAEIRPVGTAGPLLGSKMGETFSETAEYPWPKGAQLLLYTDGLTDGGSEENNSFGRRALLQELKRLGKLRGKKLLNELLTVRQRKLGSDLPDDITVVSCVRS